MECITGKHIIFSITVKDKTIHIKSNIKIFVYNCNKISN